jgi:hypothetical protein
MAKGETTHTDLNISVPSGARIEIFNTIQETTWNKRIGSPLIV